MFPAPPRAIAIGARSSETDIVAAFVTSAADNGEKTRAGQCKLTHNAADEFSTLGVDIASVFLKHTGDSNCH
jgi:hypothetical protein